MAEAKFGSAGVSTREIDLSAPLSAEPVGVPAGVIGTSTKGPAFVPVTTGITKDYFAKFGETDGKKFGPLAVSEWLRNAQAVTFIRVLGIGDGKKRNTVGSNIGNVTNAGFVVGEEQPNAAGSIAANPYANSGGVNGRTYMLGCFMSESAGSTFLSEAGKQTTAAAVPIIRGVLMAASGVVVRLSSSFAGTNTAPASTAVAAEATGNGSIIGSVKLLDGTTSKTDFVLLLNGHKGTDTDYPNVVTASFDVTSPNYFANLLNKNPLKLQEYGYVLYKHWDIHPSLAAVTGTSVVAETTGRMTTGQTVEAIAFCTSGSAAYNVGSTTVPNFENFENRFAAAKMPWVISQKFGGSPVNLFRLHSLDDGEYAHNRIKISVENITPSADTNDQYGSFDLIIRSLDDTDINQVVLEKYRGINLNPASDRYIAKVIGDAHLYYDLDRATDSQKLVMDGNFPNLSNYVRVEMDTQVDNAESNATALPMGFRGIYHMMTSGSAPMTSPSGTQLASATALKSVQEPPVPFRRSVTNGSSATEVANASLYWGVQFEHVTSLTTRNASTLKNKSIENFGKYMPDFMTTNMNVWAGENQGVSDTAANGVLDADRFNNNMFTLENVKVVTASNGLANASEWVSAVYVREGAIAANATAKTRAFATTDLTTTNKRFAKFSLFMQGGFDGVNIFDEEEVAFTNTAVNEEMTYSNRGLINATVGAAYNKAITIMKNTSDVDVQLLAIPGIRHSSVTDNAILATEERFDALYLMDIEEYDVLNTLVTGSDQTPSVTNTVSNFTDRSLDNSFAAAYYPDVIMTDPTTKTNVVVPASVAVLGAFALNDAVGHPWFAPAGFTRGALPTVTEAKVKLSKANLDLLYDAKVNPIVAFPGATSTGATGGPIVWGQKTLQIEQSALDRVNVRRLLIELRREAREVANTLIFEPNREATLTKFTQLMEPRMARVKNLAGVNRYLIKVDTTTTTQADIENNTIRGKIWIEPTKTIEFVSLDFVVKNSL